MKYVWYIFAVLASFNLVIDIMVFFDTFIAGERLHPQLLQHWPINILLVIFFWYMVARERESKS